MSRIAIVMRSKAHFSYAESYINALLDAGYDVLLAFDKYWSHLNNPSHVAFNNWHAQHPEVPVCYFPAPTSFFRKALMWCRELRSFNSYCTRGDEFDFYRNRWSHYLRLPEAIRSRIVQKRFRRLFGSVLLRKALAAIEEYSPADNVLTEWLKRKNIKGVIATPCNMRYNSEIEVVKAAKKLRLPTIIPILSWDNAATKGLFYIKPSRLLAWHEDHKSEAVRYHRIAPGKITIVGAPFFDKWFDTETKATPRDVFCRRIGLNPEQPYVLYLGSSANIAADETWLTSDIWKAMQAQMPGTQLIFRPHPANWKNGLKLLEEGIQMWPREGTLPDDANTFQDFYDTLHHASAVISLNTSGMVDAIICNKPVVSPVVERYRFTQENAEHFQRMRDADTLYIAQDAAETVSHLQAISEGRDPLAPKRAEFVDRFVRPCGREVSAGKRVAEVVLSLIPVGEKKYRPSPSAVTEHANTNLSEAFGKFKERVEEERNSPLYQFYLAARDRILSMMQQYETSRYWYEEVMGFDYLFDASPLVVSKIREHCYHITGERGYSYRQHHAHAAAPFARRLEALQALDKSNLFLPEPPVAGGFGHVTPHGKVNIDTLKFYEVLIGMDTSGCLESFKNSTGERKAALEIGSGWGGFAYQFKTLFPNTTYFCIDLPPTLLFAAIYLRATLPQANIVLWGDMPPEELFARWKEFDIVLIPAGELEAFAPPQLDLTVNMCSFQEMTTAQATAYVDHVAALGCTHLYSLNRDHSKHNPEMSLVSEVIGTRYNLSLIPVLPTQYCMVGSKTEPATPAAAKKASEHPSSYRHLAGTLRAEAKAQAA